MLGDGDVLAGRDRHKGPGFRGAGTNDIVRHAEGHHLVVGHESQQHELPAGPGEILQCNDVQQTRFIEECKAEDILVDRTDGQHVQTVAIESLAVDHQQIANPGQSWCIDGVNKSQRPAAPGNGAERVGILVTKSYQLEVVQSDERTGQIDTGRGLACSSQDAPLEVAHIRYRRSLEFSRHWH